MKVAFLLGSLNRGGAENLILDIFRNSDNSKFEIIGIYRKTGLLLDSFQKTQNTFTQCKVKRFNVPLYLFTLRKILLNNQIDIVHSQMALDTILAKIATIGTKIKIASTIHGFDFESSLFSKFLIKLSITLSDTMCFVSNYQADYFKSKYKIKNTCNTAIIYNGIDLKKIITKDQSSFNEFLKIGTVGNFTSVRNQLFICTFLNHLKEKGIVFDFIFVGSKSQLEPDLYDKCIDYCNSHNLNDCVHFIGSSNNVPKILNELDAFIYSSVSDTFGIAVIEAIATGTPVFVNDWDVMSEITGKGQLANMYISNDIDSLFDIFYKFTQNRQAYNVRALKNATQARRKFGIKAHIDNLFDVYSLTLNK